MADYQKVIARAARKAFRQIGTLAKDVVFSSSQPPSFDFSNATSTNGAVTTLTIKVVETKTKQKKDSDVESMNARLKSLLLLTEDAPDLNPYDTVAIAGEVWKVVLPIENDGFITTVNVTKEL